VQHWYVYYKLRSDERAATVAQVRGMQERLARAGNVRARLLERTEQAEMVTVMEVYEDIEEAGRFAGLLDEAVRSSGLSEALIAARRVERFRDA
jgi:hypothetical protein